MTGLGDQLKGLLFEERIRDLYIKDPNGKEVITDGVHSNTYRKVSGRVIWEVIGGKADHGAECKIVAVQCGSDTYFKVGDVAWVQHWRMKQLFKSNNLVNK